MPFRVQYSTNSDGSEGGAEFTVKYYKVQYSTNSDGSEGVYIIFYIIRWVQYSIF